MSLSRRRLLFVLISLAVSAVAFPARRAVADDAADEKGFVKLFDGKSTKGWHGYKGAKLGKGWVAEKGVLTRHGKGGDMVSADSYADFELRLDWKISPGGNSGVMYRVAETEDKPYMTGPEYQVLDNDKHHDGKNPLTSAGSLYGLYAPEGAELKPVGQWNSTRIVVKGNHVEHWLNDKKVVDCEIGSDDWNKRLAGSKFTAWKQYGKPTEGHIVLQDHGDQVSFRNIRIKKL